MTKSIEQQIVDEAPCDTWTHAMNRGTYVRMISMHDYEYFNWLTQQWHEITLLPELFGIRSRKDIEVIIEKDKKIAELETALLLTNEELSLAIDEVNTMREIHHRCTMTPADLWDKETCHINQILLAKGGDV